MESFKTLSERVGLPSIGWRYAPIFISKDYPVEKHIHDFEQMAVFEKAINSSLDVPKTKGARSERWQFMGKWFSKFARKQSGYFGEGFNLQRHKEYI